MFRTTRLLKIVKLPNFKEDKEGKCLKLATEHSAGLDITAGISEPMTIKRGEVKLIPTGLKVACPVDCYIQLSPRSGTALKKGFSIVNTPGIIDSDYRGEVKIIATCVKDEMVIEPGERIAQMIMLSSQPTYLMFVDELDETERGEGGFGSTGK